MKEQRMVEILRENYSLSELEERLELTTEDLEDGWRYYVEDNYDEVLEFLKEDLWFS
jgi:tRNA1(Val) A37 N6-methylase TrmN6